MSESQNVTLTTLSATLADQHGITKTLASELARSLVQGIIDAVVAGETVRISGFGTIEAADTAAKTGRNPQDGTPLEIPASKRISFKASKPFKDAVKATV